MKKIILGFLLSIFVIGTSHSQETASDAGMYVSGSLSTSTGDSFETSTYPSLELGLFKKNFSFGAVAGRSNLDFSIKDDSKNYYLEGKTAATTQIGAIKGFVMFGYGMYINTSHGFIEYGGGIIHSIKQVDVSVQVSNFDRINYVSLGLTYNISF